MDYQTITDQWTQRVVIDLGLCPFAWQSIQEKRLHKKVIEAAEPAVVFAEFMDTILWLEEHPEVESSLITLPNAFPEFEDFLEAKEMAETLLADAGFEGIYQIAAFHPHYQFAGTEPDDPSNYTNRAPYPIFHPIREAAMTKAIDSHPAIETIPKLNIEKTRSLGIEHMRSLLQSCFKID